MYNSITCTASEVLVDDCVNIGENAMLYRITEIESNTDAELGEFVMMRLGITDSDIEPTMGALVLKPRAVLTVYRQ